MLIETEETYNPNVRNFYLNIKAFDERKAEYADCVTADASELAQSILKIKGVEKVLILPDMLFVEKNDNADFSFLAPQIMAEIVDFDFAKFQNFDFSKQDISAQINALVEAKIRPFLKADGGDIEVVGFENGTVNVRLQGRCKGCVHAKQTMKNIVEALLKKYIGGVLSVREQEDG